MWSNTFEQRLVQWNQLRKEVNNIPLDECLWQINEWWFSAPWCAYHLHWDEIESWPDPWQLLSDNIYCDLARALGIVYTIAIINRPDCQQIELVETEQGNLVQINDGKYILNWSRDSVVNTSPKTIKVLRRCTQYKLKQIQNIQYDTNHRN